MFYAYIFGIALQRVVCDVMVVGHCMWAGRGDCIMAKKRKSTLHDRFVKALEARGCKPLPTRHGAKVTIMQAVDGDGCYYIGKAGALRVGITKARSIPVSAVLRDRLLQEVPE
jgi:hypothetical protein